jgi:hypothetical protein
MNPGHGEENPACSRSGLSLTLSIKAQTVPYRTDKVIPALILNLLILKFVQGN